MPFARSRSRQGANVATLTAALLLVVPAAAHAAAGAHPAASAAVLPVVSGSIFTSLGHVLLGAFSWTVDLGSKFLLTTIAALVRLLIPQSWVHEGLQVMQWIVAVPDYAGKITAPGGGSQYGFAGINDLRDVLMWVGIAVAPLALVYATSQAMVDLGDPVGIPVLRMLAVSVVIASYPYWWGQAAALTDELTNVILTVPEVSQGLYRLMDYAVGGVALGGWQLIDLGLMAAIGIELLGLIFMKVALILTGAILYAAGPLMIGLVPTRAGSVLARAWTTATLTIFGVGVLWSIVLAVGAVLIGDASSAGSLIGGGSTFGSLAGGLLVAVAGLASLWLCLKLAREAGTVLRGQLTGQLALLGTRGTRGGGAPLSGPERTRTTGGSLRQYGSRLAQSTRAAGAGIAASGPAGAAAVGGARAAAFVGRRGLVGTAMSGAQHGGRSLTRPVGSRLGSRRAGTVASRAARAGTATQNANPPSTPAAAATPRTETPPPAAGGSGGAPGARDKNRPGAPSSTRPPRGASSAAPASTPRGRRANRSPLGAAAGDGARNGARATSSPDGASERTAKRPARPKARPPSGDRADRPNTPGADPSGRGGSGRSSTDTATPPTAPPAGERDARPAGSGRRRVNGPSRTQRSKASPVPSDPRRPKSRPAETRPAETRPAGTRPAGRSRRGPDRAPEQSGPEGGERR